MKRTTLLALTFLAGAALAPSARAQAPNVLTYQGRLKESGQPVTAGRLVDIKLCSTFTGLTCTSTGAQGVSVANGLFRSTFTVPLGVDLANGPWFIEVNVGGLALSPREQLSSSPYAVYSTSAAALTAAAGTAEVVASTALFVNGPLRYATTSINANYTMNGGEGVIFADATLSAISVTLPKAGPGTIGRFYRIYKTDASGNPVGAVPQGGDSVTGTSSAATRSSYIEILGFTASSWIGRGI